MMKDPNADGLVDFITEQTLDGNRRHCIKEQPLEERSRADWS